MQVGTHAQHPFDLSYTQDIDRHRPATRANDERVAFQDEPLQGDAEEKDLDVVFSIISSSDSLANQIKEMNSPPKIQDRKDRIQLLDDKSKAVDKQLRKMMSESNFSEHKFNDSISSAQSQVQDMPGF